MVAAFPPGAQDVVVSCAVKLFIVLRQNFVSQHLPLTVVLISFVCWIAEDVIAVGVSRW
jgi:hypothetical protein